MILKLKKEAGIPAFFNKDILFIDFKTVKLDRVLTNLFIKMYADGYSVTSAFKKEFTMNSLKQILAESEKQKRGNGLSGRFGMARGCRLSGRAVLMPGGQVR